MSVFAGERVTVIGLGVAGRAAARVLAEEGAVVRVLEERPDAADDTDELTAAGVEIVTGPHLGTQLDGSTAVVPSPGVPESAPILSLARDRGIAVWSELDVGARLCRVPYVAVTGTNGKSTTTSMVAAMMRAAGLDAVACGNIGYPFSLAVREGHQALAVEASSFQLRFHHWLHPRVSVLLNLAADHVDWHGSVEAYAAAKSRVFELQGPRDTHIGNADDAAAARVSRGAPCSVAWFTMAEPAPGQVGVIATEIVARVGEDVVLGRPFHDSAGYRADAAAASAAALAFGLPVEAVSEVVRTMPPLPHRGEEVARAGSVSFVDDSKATNPHAALHALDGRHDVVLIAGGLAKGVDLSPMLAALPNLAGLVAIGDARDELVRLFDGRVSVRTASSMEEAVRISFALAPKGGTVLLAPACASWDMFRDYAERGDRFAAAAREIGKETARGE